MPRGDGIIGVKLQHRGLPVHIVPMPKVEFMLSSFFGEISSSGYLRRSAASPSRDSTGGA